jgi:ABC-type Mn2+/Zn2+ transport system permease subunit
LAIARAYATAAGRLFERAALHAFAQDLTAALVYSGCAWGAGAFLVLPGSAPIGSALVFAAVPALGIGLLLRERRAVLFFLAPVAALTSFACVLRQFSDGTMNAALVLIASAIVAATLILFHRREAGLAPDAATFDLLNL